MRIARFVLCFAVAVVLAGPAAANVGTFHSFSTTVTPIGNGLNFDSVLTTTGATTLSPSDYVLMAILAGPVNQNITTCDNIYDLTGTSTGTAVYRGLGGHTFRGQFSFTGLQAQAYKWGAVALYVGGSPTFSSTTIYSYLSSFLNNTLCPFVTDGVNAGGTTFTISNTTDAPDPGVFRLAVQLGRQGLENPIPVLGTWALLALGVLVAAAGLIILRRT